MKKRPKTKFSKLKDDITKIDEVTYYVKGSEPEPYMVYKDLDNRWLCDCMDWTVVLMKKNKGKDQKKELEIPECKHVIRVKNLSNPVSTHKPST